MQLDFSALEPLERYRWLASTIPPRPIAWVSSLSDAGVSNLAPFSFFQVISDDPPTLMVNVNHRADGGLKDTLLNVQASGELVIQLVSFAQAEAMNASAAVLPYGISEFEQCGIASLPSQRVAPPRRQWLSPPVAALGVAPPLGALPPQQPLLRFNTDAYPQRYRQAPTPGICWQGGSGEDLLHRRPVGEQQLQAEQQADHAPDHRVIA